MIRCLCGQSFENDEWFVKHRQAMEEMKGQKGKHKIICSRCGKDGLLPSFSYVFQACGKINSVMHDICYDAIFARISNDGYSPGKSPRR